MITELDNLIKTLHTEGVDYLAKSDDMAVRGFQERAMWYDGMAEGVAGAIAEITILRNRLISEGVK